jgi:hypothetical protein
MTKTVYLTDGVTYSFSLAAKKWVFRTTLYGKKYEILTSVKRGAEVAKSIAALLRAGLIKSRGKELDPKVREKIQELAVV